MNILQNKRKRCFALIGSLAAFTHRACRRIQKKGPVIRFAVVITGGAESQRPGKNQQRWRKFPPAVSGIDQRRIKRREIRSPLVKLAFKCAQRGVKPESAK